MGMLRASTGGHARALGSRWGIGPLVATLALGGATLAGAPAAEEGRRLGFRLDRERLVPRVSIELESFSSFHRAAHPGLGLDDHVLFDQLTDAVRRGTKSVTRKTVRKHVLQAIRLDRGIRQLRDSIRGSEGRDMGFHFGVHSMLPEVGMHYRLHQGRLAFTVGAEGDVALRFRADRFHEAELAADFDKEDDAVRIKARLGF